MDIFTILILTHFVSDWLFQPGKWAVKKVKETKFRLYHCIQYAIIFLPVLYLLNINLLWAIWIFATHFFIDDYKFVVWWNKKIRNKNKQTPRWILIVQDQVLHLLVLIPLIL